MNCSENKLNKLTPCHEDEDLFRRILITERNDIIKFILDFDSNKLNILNNNKYFAEFTNIPNKTLYFMIATCGKEKPKEKISFEIIDEYR